MSESIQFHSRVGDDGVLQVQVNLGSAEASKEVVVTVEPVNDSSDSAPTDTLPWQEFVQATYGSCAGLGLERGDQGDHKTVNHIISYVEGRVHTNGLENFWSLLKRSIGGTYIAVEPQHLSRYCDEQAFRFNRRKGTDATRFLEVLLSVVGKRLTYDQLIGKA